MVNALGPYYFKFVLTSLSSTLTKGYQLHVLGYTLHSLLQTLIEGYSSVFEKGKEKKKKKKKKKGEEEGEEEGEEKEKEGGIEVGSLDHCVEDVMVIVMEELFGELAEKKGVTKIAFSMKETGASKAMHCVLLLSSVVSFPVGVWSLLNSGFFFYYYLFYFIFLYFYYFFELFFRIIFSNYFF